MKAKRHKLLIELLESGEIDSQHTAVKRLEEHGIAVTQATLSRDLEELGAMRIKAGQHMRYALPAQNSRFGAQLSQVLKDYVISKRTSGNIIVFITPPGHAGMVAAALDRASFPEVLGIVAGDDTLFICVEETLGAAKALAIIEAATQ
jgi:transcriptional regulator of arginine metabolism